jgi:predicted lipid-binding transport protein (Tim44 family)
VIIQIVILAMIAAFLGMRLYSVLGRRAEHEEESIPTRFDDQLSPPSAPQAAQAAMPRPRELVGVLPAVEQGVREIAAADRRFDITAFLEGAKGAYGMVLEAFWNGDKASLRELCDDDVYESFAGAIDLTRDKDGVMIAGSLDDAIETRDIWTFSRDVTSGTPEWVLDETDEG